MRVIFAGTPGFAVPALRALVHAGHTVALVLTQPDRPAGRGMAAQPGAVKRSAIELGLPIYQPAGLKDAASQARLAAAESHHGARDRRTVVFSHATGDG